MHILRRRENNYSAAASRTPRAYLINEDGQWGSWRWMNEVDRNTTHLIDRMPAWILTLVPSMDAVSFDYETPAPAFTVIHKDGFDSFSLPLVQPDKGLSNSSSTGTIIIACSRNERTSKFISRRRLCKSNEHLLAASLQVGGTKVKYYLHCVNNLT